MSTALLESPAALEALRLEGNPFRNYFARNPDDFYERAYEGMYCVGCESFKQESEIVDGKCDSIPEQAFYMAGAIEEVHENAKKLAGQAPAAKDDKKPEAQKPAAAAKTEPPKPAAASHH